MRSKKGETTDMTIMPVMTLLLAIALILLPLLKYTHDIGTKNNYDRVYLSRDVALLIDTVVGIPNNIIVEYPEEISDMLIDIDQDNVVVLEAKDQTNSLRSVYPIFKMANQLYDVEKMDSKISIGKSSTSVSVKKEPITLDNYYIPEKITSFKESRLGYLITADTKEINGFKAQQMANAYTALIGHQAPDYTLELTFYMYSETNENGAYIVIPRNDATLAIFAGNIANRLSVSFSPVYVLHAKGTNSVDSGQLEIHIGNPNIQDNILKDDGSIRSVMRSIKSGIGDAFE